MSVTFKDLIKAYDVLVRGIDAKAQEDVTGRAYGGIVRAGKGRLVENIARHLVEIAWEELGGSPDRLSFDRDAQVIRLNKKYLKRIKDSEVAKYIAQNIEDYHYDLRTDVHVSLDGDIKVGIECKAYTENAMLKRILVDFALFRTVCPNLKCVLIQLESQLGGDYGDPSKETTYGSHSTHTLLSHFDVDLNILTLVEGERRIDRPIHAKEHYKPLLLTHLRKAAGVLKSLLQEFA